MDKIYFDRKFILGLSTYITQIDLSICRIENSPWNKFTKFFKDRIEPKNVTNYLAKNVNFDIEKTESIKNQVMFNAMRNYLDVPAFHQDKKKIQSRIKSLLKDFPKVSLWKKMQGFYINLINSEQLFLTKDELMIIHFFLKKFQDLLDLESIDNIPQITGLRIPLAYLNDGFIKYKLTPKERILIRDVEQFNQNNFLKYYTLQELIEDEAWI